MSEAYVAESLVLLGKFSLLDITDTEEPVSSVMDRDPVFLEPENSLTESLEVAADFVGEYSNCGGRKNYRRPNRGRPFYSSSCYPRAIESRIRS